jgi:hypothetical protein
LKNLLIMLIVATCVIGLRSPDFIQQALGIKQAVQSPAQPSVESLIAASPSGQRPMSADEFANLSKTDPNAYRKFISSHEVEERTEVDKLMNFLARGKYE